MPSHGFWHFGIGRVLVTVTCCLLLWGVTLALWVSGSGVALIVILISAVFGWSALSMITPVIFIWLPLGGWLIYIVMKFALSVLIGLFVAPFRIGAALADRICDYL